jgi:hypothetical protein
MEATGLLSTRIVFDGDTVEVFQSGRSVARIAVADLRDVRMEQKKKWTEMRIETTWGPVLTPERRPLPLAFDGPQLVAAHSIADALGEALRGRG